AAAPTPAPDDPVSDAVRAWLANHAKHEALIHEWQDLEGQLWRKAGGPIRVARGVREGYAEAKRMRRITRRTNRLGRKLEAQAARAAGSRQPPTARAKATGGGPPALAPSSKWRSPSWRPTATNRPSR